MISDSIMVLSVLSHVLVSTQHSLYSLIVKSLFSTGTHFEQGTFCVSECQPGFQTVGRVCEPCPNGMCVGRKG